MLFDDNQRINPKEYEIFQQTQLATLKSHFVLNAALNRSDISQLEAVFKEKPDALAWLSDELRVSFPGDGEILEVRFDGEENPEEIMKLVDAVIEAYTDEVIWKERTRSSVTRESLKKLHKELGVAMEEGRWPVTFSIGAVTFETPVDSSREALRLTDGTMYAVKRAGKDGIQHAVWDGEWGLP